jgi:hypothetical protein
MIHQSLILTRTFMICKCIELKPLRTIPSNNVVLKDSNAFLLIVPLGIISCKMTNRNGILCLQPERMPSSPEHAPAVLNFLMPRFLSNLCQTSRRLRSRTLAVSLLPTEQMQRLRKIQLRPIPWTHMIAKLSTPISSLPSLAKMKTLFSFIWQNNVYLPLIFGPSCLNPSSKMPLPISTVWLLQQILPNSIKYPRLRGIVRHSGRASLVCDFDSCCFLPFRTNYKYSPFCRLIHWYPTRFCS